jgi:hypothetical protein
VTREEGRFGALVWKAEAAGGRRHGDLAGNLAGVVGGNSSSGVARDRSAQAPKHDCEFQPLVLYCLKKEEKFWK